MSESNQASDLPNPHRPQASGPAAEAKQTDDRAGRERPNESTNGLPDPAFADPENPADQG